MFIIKPTFINHKMEEVACSTYAMIAEGIYVGNRAASCDVRFLADADITAIINLTPKKPKVPVEGIDYFDFIVLQQELLDTEFPKTTAKLESIASTVRSLRAAGRSILIFCEDGKNSCMLAAGYYLINSAKQPYATVIENLEVMYLDPASRKAELADRREFAADACNYAERIDSLPDFARALHFAEKNTRRQNLCLTMASFRKLLRLSGGAKK